MWQALLHLLSNIVELYRRYKDESRGREKALKEVEDENRKQREKISAIRDGEPLLDFLLHPDERNEFELSKLRADISEKRRGHSLASANFGKDGEK